MPRDSHGNEISIGDRVQLTAVVESVFHGGPETKNLCLRLQAPPGAPNAIVYCSGISVEKLLPPASGSLSPEPIAP